MTSMTMARRRIMGAAIGAALIAVSAGAQAQQQPAASSDSDYIAKMMTGAPQSVVSGATIVAIDKNGAMRTIQKGTNDFTCAALPDGSPMCTDKNGWQWMSAFMTHKSPPAGIGFAYMLNGDDGASNTDPYASAASPANHWIKTGPHVMILGPAARSLGYPRSPDADPTKPFVMWAGTPYEHVMIPVK
jgi:hypothetical protein